MRNYSIDTLKLICVILVIFIHTPQPEVWSRFITPIYRCAVPIFFMISGYFTYGKNNIESTIRKRIIPLLRMFFVVFLIHFFISIIDNGKETLEESVKFLYPSFYVCNFVPIGIHLWYIWAYIYVLLVMLVVERYNLYKPLFCVVPILFIGAILLGKYSEPVFGRIFPACGTRNWLFTALPFFALGMVVRRVNLKVPRLATIIFCIVFYLVGLFEVAQIANVKGDLYISTISLSLSIFLLFINIEQKKDTLFSKLGREDGLYIYLFHYFIATYVAQACGKMPVLTYVSAPLVFCLTLLFIAFLRKMQVIGKII